MADVYEKQLGAYTCVLDDEKKVLFVKGQGLQRTVTDEVRVRLHATFDGLTTEADALAWVQAK